MADRLSNQLANPDAFTRARAIFEAALPMDGTERELLLDDSCGSDSALRATVERMLKADGAPHALLDGGPVLARDRWATGDAFLHFRIGALIGRGGMGQVYQARDLSLKRDVALKVLPVHAADTPADRDRTARLREEAHTLAALNHPNIATIHGLVEADGVRALVLELVDGQTLAERLAEGPMPIDDAIIYARQIAGALEAAHEQSIVHRDLKPSNIKRRPDGTVKLLDFGLAKIVRPVSSGSAANHASKSGPSISPGAVAGTAAYMSPEQARGREGDRRSDIWAFGAVLFEMLSGDRAFSGRDVAATLAAVTAAEIAWSRLPPHTPQQLRQLLARCLDPDAARRLRDIGEARIVLDDLLDGRATLPVSAATTGRPRLRLIVAAATAAVATVGIVFWPRPSSPPSAVTLRPAAGTGESAAGPVRFPIAAPPNASFGGPRTGGSGVATQLAISPDGRSIAFVAGAPPAFQIWLRPMANPSPMPISGTDGGTFPFWSPDSQFVGFFADGKMKKVEISTGHVTELSDAPSGRGGTWNRDNVIVFAPSNRAGTGLLRVSSAGGPTAPVTHAEAALDQYHAWPYFLPDGFHFVYTASTGICCPPPEPAHIRIGSLDPAEPATTLFDAESSVSYAAGHLLFGREDTLMAQPFDPEMRQPAGDPLPVAEHVSTEGSRYVSVSASENGTLVYGQAATLVTARQLTWFDREGRSIGTIGESEVYSDIALSPDERRIAVSIGTPSNPGSPNRDIWVVEVSRSVVARRTFDPGMDHTPVWSADSASIAFSGWRSGRSSLRLTRLDGTADELLLEGPARSPRVASIVTPTSWSSDGRYLAYSATGDVWALPLLGDRKPFPVVQSKSVETSGVFSPDGRWIAYSSNQEGRFNVYVQAFPSGASKHQVSTGGGSQPVWRADGRELFYLAPDATLVAVPVTTSPAFATTGPPQRLFPTRADMPVYGAPIPRFNVYAPTRDGQRFLVASPQPSGAAPMTVVVNWVVALQK